MTIPMFIIGVLLLITSIFYFPNFETYCEKGKFMYGKDYTESYVLHTGLCFDFQKTNLIADFGESQQSLINKNYNNIRNSFFNHLFFMLRLFLIFKALNLITKPFKNRIENIYIICVEVSKVLAMVFCLYLSLIIVSYVFYGVLG